MTSRFAGAIPCSNPIHVLREIPDLVQGIPHRQLQLTSRMTRGKKYLHVSEVLFGIGERDGVSNSRRRVRRCINRGQMRGGNRRASCES